MTVNNLICTGSGNISSSTTRGISVTNTGATTLAVRPASLLLELPMVFPAPRSAAIQSMTSLALVAMPASILVILAHRRLRVFRPAISRYKTILPITALALLAANRAAALRSASERARRRASALLVRHRGLDLRQAAHTSGNDGHAPTAAVAGEPMIERRTDHPAKTCPSWCLSSSKTYPS